MEIMKESAPKAEAPVATYDPKKNYTWGPETEFVVKGAEFGILLNSLRAVLGSAEAQRILLAERASSVIENMLADAVESGKVKEKQDEQKSTKG